MFKEKKKTKFCSEELYLKMEEVLKKLEAYGTNIHPRPSKSTGNVSVSFNPEYVKLVMDQMLKKSSVEYFLHAQMYEVVNNNGMIEEISFKDFPSSVTNRSNPPEIRYTACTSGYL